ncbi:hypothetical protein OpiT1DRAFT_05602 [Opitutaceae bacterium TAV1]|nr:hypothetical protein OpiT1DRAFT_05602 [Opitutaceae bacterium TAV1]
MAFRTTFMAVIWVVILAGCGASSKVYTTKEVTSILDPQKKKDETTVGAANNIDHIVENTPQQPAVREQTDAIRAAVAAAPAEKVVELVAGLMSSNDTLTKKAETLQQKYDDLKNSIDRKVQFWTAMGLRLIGAVFLLMVVLRVKAAISTGGVGWLDAAKSSLSYAGIAATAFSLSKLISQPWFWYACYAFVGLIVVAIVWLALREQKRTSTLAAVVKTVDAVYDGAAPAVKADMDAETGLFGKLSDAMQRAAKQVIHEIRAEPEAAKATTAV